MNVVTLHEDTERNEMRITVQRKQTQILNRSKRRYSWKLSLIEYLCCQALTPRRQSVSATALTGISMLYGIVPTPAGTLGLQYIIWPNCCLYRLNSPGKYLIMLSISLCEKSAFSLFLPQVPTSWFSLFLQLSFRHLSQDNISLWC